MPGPGFQSVLVVVNAPDQEFTRRYAGKTAKEEAEAAAKVWREKGAVVQVLEE